MLPPGDNAAREATSELVGSGSAGLGCFSNRERGHYENCLPLNGAIDLDTLDDYLMSDHAPHDRMGLSDLDGFLTGIAVGPRDAFLAEVPEIVPASSPAFTSFGKTIRSRYRAEVAASREAADASETTAGINRQLTAQ